MYFAKYELPRLNFRWLVMGCYFPDGMGLSKVALTLTGDSSVHRDVLFGWTHSLPVCGAVALGVGSIFGKRAGWSFAFAAWLHTIMDLGDPLGAKVFYPFSDHKYALALWPWTDRSLVTDLLAYYVSPVSFFVDALFLVLAVYACVRMTGSYNPVRATLALWARDGWSDRSAAVVPVEETLVNQPN